MGQGAVSQERVDRAHKTGVLTLKEMKLQKLPKSLVELLKQPSTLAVALKSLDLSGNIFDTIPEQLVSMTMLKYFAMARNRLRGSLNLMQLSLKLESLDLDDNRLVRIDIQCSLPSLKHLKLCRNELETITGLQNAPSLVALYCSNNRLRCMPENLPEFLQELHLEHNLISEIPPVCVSNLSQLSFLDIRHNRLSILPPQLFQSTMLKSLDVLEGNLMTHSQLQQIQGFAEFSDRRKDRVDQLLK
jgi:Leucine-rich repeat (LRR) protein